MSTEKSCPFCGGLRGACADNCFISLFSTNVLSIWTEGKACSLVPNPDLAAAWDRRRPDPELLQLLRDAREVLEERVYRANRIAFPQDPDGRCRVGIAIDHYLKKQEA